MIPVRCLAEASGDKLPDRGPRRSRTSSSGFRIFRPHNFSRAHVFSSSRGFPSQSARTPIAVPFLPQPSASRVAPPADRRAMAWGFLGDVLGRVAHRPAKDTTTGARDAVVHPTVLFLPLFSVLFFPAIAMPQGFCGHFFFPGCAPRGSRDPRARPTATRRRYVLTWKSRGTHLRAEPTDRRHATPPDRLAGRSEVFPPSAASVSEHARGDSRVADPLGHRSRWTSTPRRSSADRCAPVRDHPRRLEDAISGLTPHACEIAPSPQGRRLRTRQTSEPPDE